MSTGAIYEARLNLETMLTDLALTMFDGQPFTVHRYPPGQATGPMVYLDMPRLDRYPQTITATYPVIFGFDGADHRQCEAMDIAQAAAWDLFTSTDGYAVESADPDTLDIGGAQIRALAFLVTVDLRVMVLCPALTHLTTE